MLALLAVMGVAMFSSSVQECVAWDEAAHLTNGYLYWRTGNFWYGQVNPALARLAVGLPLLALDPRIPTEHESYREYAQFPRFRSLFLYRNRVPPDTLLLWGRSSTMLLTLLLGAVIALWTRRHFGPGPALGALALFALDPNFIAYGRYTTTDLYGVSFQFFAILAWAWFLTSKRAALPLLVTGLLAGLAMAAKHSSIFLFGLFPLLYCIRWWQAPRPRALLRLAAALAAVGLLTALTVAAVYWPVSWKILLRGTTPLAEAAAGDTPVDQTFRTLGQVLHLPAHPYLMGFYWLAKSNEAGIPTYLLGQTALFGWWYFFPVAFAVKTPTGLLLGLAACFVVLVRLAPRSRLVEALRRLDFAWIAIAVPPAVYFGLCFLSDINSGIRHLMLIYPFLFILLAAILVGQAHRRLMAVVTLLVAIESVLIYPHYLAFFNLPSGGPASGAKYLVDSSLDWGQDLKKLRAYLDTLGVDDIYLAYHGMGDPAYYGIRWRFAPERLDAEQQRELNAVVAVSATYLKGLYVGEDSYDWLGEHEPVARIGYSIYVYDLRH